MPSTPSVERNIQAEEKAKAGEITSIVESYLSSTLDAREAAEQLTSAIERILGSPEDTWPPHLIYDEILSRIRAVSHDDPLQDKFVALLAAIKQIDSPKVGRKYWDSLWPFGMTVRELWNSSDAFSIEEWTSLNAFVARLSMSDVVSFDSYGIWAMRYGIEDGTERNSAEVAGKIKEGELNPVVLDKQVPAAAVWIFYCGLRMWRLAEQGADQDTRSTRGGPKWEGPFGHSVQRWKFWEERFDYFSGREYLKPETSRFASKACTLMREARDEKNM